MKPRHFLPILLALTGALHAQGPLTPPVGTPGPEMKSLQQIWDKIGGLEAQVSQAQSELTRLRTENQASSNRIFSSSPDTVFTWTTSKPQTAGVVGSHTSMAFGPDGQPAIAYYDVTGGNLMFTRFDGTTWQTHPPVDSGGNVGTYASLAFGPDGQPAISYYDVTGGNLKFARYDGSNWNVTAPDTSGNVGSATSLSFDPDGQPAISYVTTEPAASIKLARFNATTVSWDFSIAATDLYFPDTGTSLAFSPTGQPAISYVTDNGDGESFGPRVAFQNGGSWVGTSVGSEANADLTSSLAYGPDGIPSLSYCVGFLNGSYRLRFARYIGNSWSVAPDLDASGGSAGQFSSLAYGVDGQPAISYYEAAGANLRFIRFNGTSWTATVLASAGAVGKYSSLAFGPDGHPAVAYFDESNGDLGFARRTFYKPAP